MDHELYDAQATNDPNTILYLRECGILNFFQIPWMRDHVHLLEHLIQMWDPEQQHFQFGTHILTLYVEDICFLIKISRRGNPVSLSRPRGGDMTINDRIDQYCTIGTHCQGGKIPIKHGMDHLHRTVLFTIEKVLGSRATHQTMQSHMLYALACMVLNIFN